jgi:hypothetical protein
VRDIDTIASELRLLAARAPRAPIYVQVRSASRRSTGGRVALLDRARATRAGELANKAADALAHCERLIVVVTGDLHTEQA